ncbi:hypothetical protein VI03_30995 [Burkholderia vietnamiensis]|uniref:hypothetical protein n=1 Tax=Burkholderia vietnamiensis TaxID=60552 RepID=UPI000621FBFF|nr:hypothetical protein [Burkholderia vietnamiensis]KKI34967.1 hypothetical protein VI03_30995 [Burkholderia vietnamiensis]
MYLFLIVARVSGSDNEFSCFLKPAADEQSAQEFVLAHLTEGMDDDDKQDASLEIDVSSSVGQYVAQDTLRVPHGTDWMLSADVWARVLAEAYGRA